MTTNVLEFNFKYQLDKYNLFENDNWIVSFSHALSRMVHASQPLGIALGTRGHRSAYMRAASLISLLFLHAADTKEALGEEDEEEPEVHRHRYEDIRSGELRQGGRN